MMADKNTIDIAAIARHYEHAKEKHPYFVDALQHPLTALLAALYPSALQYKRNALKWAIEEDRADVSHVLDCELAEMNLAIAQGDKAQAVEECYDAIAVLLRVVDVLEGRQALGKPDAAEGGKNV